MSIEEWVHDFRRRNRRHRIKAWQIIVGVTLAILALGWVLR